MLFHRLRFSLALAAAAAAAQPAAAQAEKVRVGTWNIEHLGFPGSRFEPNQGVPQKAADLAAHIKAAGVHVLALQEIGVTAGPGRRSKELDDTFALLNAGGDDWEYELTPNRDVGDTTQVTGVAWNRKKVSRVGTVYRFPVSSTGPGGSHWDRHPSAFKFSAGSGKTDFVVVSLHLKAGKSDANAAQRKGELEALRTQLDGFKAMFKEEDVVLIGDTNVTSATEATLAVIPGAGFTDLNAANLQTVTFGSAAFDRVYVPAQPEFAGAAMTRVPHDNDGDRTRLSDHFLVHTDVTVLADDDENPPFGNGGVVGGGGPGVPPMPAAAPPVLRILAVLPNPPGADDGNESVTLANGNAIDVTLTGWRLRDKAGNVFILSGSAPATATRSVRVQGTFTLNQGGDEVELIDPSGRVVHKVTYTAGQVRPGRFITFDE